MTPNTLTQTHTLTHWRTFAQAISLSQLRMNHKPNHQNPQERSVGGPRCTRPFAGTTTTTASWAEPPTQEHGKTARPLATSFHLSRLQPSSTLHSSGLTSSPVYHELPRDTSEHDLVLKSLLTRLAWLLSMLLVGKFDFFLFNNALKEMWTSFQTHACELI